MLSSIGGSRGHFDDEVGKCSEPELWTIRRADNLHVRQLREEIERRKRHKKAIEAAKNRLNDTEAEFVRLFYDQGRSIRDCKRIMAYSKSKLYNLRQEIVIKTAEFLGL